MPACLIRREKRILQRYGGLSASYLFLAAAATLLLLLATQTVALASADSTTLTPQEQAWLQQHPQIRVGLDPSWPPFSYFSRDHVLVGMDVDMLEALQRHLGITFNIESGQTWSEVYTKAQNHEIDMLGGLAVTPERAALFNFTDSYIEFPVGIITRTNAPFMIGFAQLEGRDVAAPRDYAPTLFLQREHPKAHLILTKNVGAALKMVSQGDAFATFDNLASANYLIKDQGLANLKVAGITDYEFALRYGVRKDWPELTNILQKGLASISDRERETIKNKWIDLDIDEMLVSHRFEHFLLMCVGIVTVASLLMMVWNWTLAREIARRKKAEFELSVARDKAVDANRMKSAFLANLSHEIRNPLNAVLGFTEILKREVANGKLKKYTDGIDAGGRTLLGIINDVLDLSKIEAGRIEIQTAPVDLCVILVETHALFVPRAAQKDLEFTFAIDPAMPPLLLLDELRLRQILYNAVTNAIKFTAHGSVRLQARWAAENKTLTLEVSDTGIGIPPEDHQRIFEPFAQREGQSPLLGGTGLGLAISKRLTEVMSGHVELNSSVGKGSTFRFIFPHVKEMLEKISQPAGRRGDLADFNPLKVLVVDDLEPNRELLKEYFQRAGHLVLDAADAEQGIVCAQTQLPDLILLDFRLPGMNGREAAKQLKADPRTTNIPVIFLSGSIQIALEAASDPTTTMLAKPLVYADLVEVMRRLLPEAVKVI